MVEQHVHMRLDRRCHAGDEPYTLAPVEPVADPDVVEQHYRVPRVGGDDHRRKTVEVEITPGEVEPDVRLQQCVVDAHAVEVKQVGIGGRCSDYQARGQN